MRLRRNVLLRKATQRRLRDVLGKLEDQLGKESKGALAVRAEEWC